MKSKNQFIQVFTGRVGTHIYYKHKDGDRILKECHSDFGTKQMKTFM